ncbi:hypothetical protein BIW11_02763 [Tropilaelaps mercedesae]|uniref:Uncharacterized protein n=1 Tax=Tropilaelaps mercedesae TaxID=418985 RepID=A0A1V9XXM2_9ACAR|nr:hypothetical protein BIW11_02763 [Tropilaelaps mercedesae]
MGAYHPTSQLSSARAWNSAEREGPLAPSSARESSYVLKTASLLVASLHGIL